MTKIIKTDFQGLYIFKYKNFFDKRGLFREVFKKKKGKENEFIFDCFSISKKKVIRGLHYQLKNSQAHFVTIVKGKIFEVALDLRKKSNTFGKVFTIILSPDKNTSAYIPKGFAHGFCGLAKENIVLYKISKFTDKKNEVGILWNDKDLNIAWPFKKPIVSKKDKKNISFSKLLDKLRL